METPPEITPHDRNTYLIKSRSGEGEHIVDIAELTCSCEYFNFHPHPLTPSCWHLEQVLKAIHTHATITTRKRTRFYNAKS